MLENVVSGLSKGIIIVADEATRATETAKKELNPDYLARQAQVRAKVALMKKQYKKVNGANKTNVDLEAARAFQQWRKEQEEADALATEMFDEMMKGEPGFTSQSQAQPQAMTLDDLAKALTPEQLAELVSKAQSQTKVG